MKILQINSCNFGSTGGIMLNIAKTAEDSGHTAYTVFPKSRSNLKKDVKNSILTGNVFTRNLHLLMSYATGFNGCFSVLSTYKILKKLDGISADIIHLHNLHNSYINLPMLFSYIKKRGIKTVWTLHDCWSFTGQCPYFTMADCEKWRDGCFECRQYKKYPASLFDRTKIMYRLKKRWFTQVDNMTIVTPSEWLAELVRRSFLKEYPVKVINNGIDLSVFCRKESDFRKKYNLADRHIILGVASPWSERKGFDVFLKLADMIDDNYAVVLVGVSETQREELPKNVIGIPRTSNCGALAEIYSAADVFVNPTREDNFPTVNIESLACGTPVVTFDTGGSPEIIDDTCGITAKENTAEALKSAIVEICQYRQYSARACRARAEKFDMNDKFKEYVELYEKF